jgi:hypothetical protein
VRAAAALWLAMLLAGCGGAAAPEPANTAAPAMPELERAAIEAGVIADPASSDLTGLYARDGDRVCIVPDQSGYRIGAVTMAGEGQACSGQGRVTREGEALRIDLGDGCAVAARFEGDRILLPARLAPECERLCTGRASLAALDVERLSDTPAEARTLRDGRGRLLCGDGD